MENEYGGAKPKTKSLARKEDHSILARKEDHSGVHTCSKEKHRRRKDCTKYKKHQMKCNKTLETDLDKATDQAFNDTDQLFECSCFDKDLGPIAEPRIELRNRKKSSNMLDMKFPPFMPHSNFQEANIFDDMDYKRNDVDVDYCNNVSDVLIDYSDTKDSTLSNHVFKKVNNQKRKAKLNDPDSVQKKDLEAEKSEIVKRHEESLREKWKRSGLALRKFLSERLGFNSNVKKEIVNDEHDNTDDQKCMHSFEEDRNICNGDKSHEKLLSFGKDKMEKAVAKKNNVKTKKTETDKLNRKSSLSSEGGSDKSSRSLISKFKLSFKSKKKKSEGVINSLKLSDDSYPSSPASCSSSNSGPLQDHLHDKDLPFFDISGGIDERVLIARFNLNGTSYSCDCHMCQETHTNSRNKAQKQTHKHSKIQSSSRKDPANIQKDKSKKLIKKVKTKKKGYVGVLDNALSSSGDEYHTHKDDDVMILKRQHKDYGRERLSSNSQDTLTPENTPPRTSHTNNTSDVLSSLHYAIPYLPPRLRNRLHTNSEDRSDGQTDNHQTTAHTEVTNKVPCSNFKPALKGKEKYSKSNFSFYDNFKGNMHGDDFSNLDRDWDNVILDTERNSSSFRSSHTGHSRGSRTNGEVSDISIFSRFQPESSATDRTSRNELIDSLDKPLVSQDAGEFIAEGRHFPDSRNGDNYLYNFDDESLLEDLVNRMDKMCLDEEDNNLGTENGCFIPEVDTDMTKDAYESTDRSDDISWSPLPVSESCDEADDEFECDCEHCSLLRQRNSSSDLNDLHDLDAENETLRQQRQDEMRFGAENEMFLPDPYVDEDLFNINVLELTSLDFMLMAESTFRLDIMLENVIQQMLAVQPELLNDQVIPPADQHTIDNLPTVSLGEEHLEQSPACPICLCPCELEEIMTSLTCSHLFHPLCIQAWLAKSGTCPVCRSPV